MRTYCFSFVMILTVWLVDWTATMASPGHYLLQIMMFCVASSMQICIDDGIARLQKEIGSDDGSNIDIHGRMIVMPFSSSFGTWASGDKVSRISSRSVVELLASELCAL